MQDGQLLNQARGTWMMDGYKRDGTQLGKRDVDDKWIQEGWLLNWVEGHFCGRKGGSIRWKDTSVGEKEAQSGGGMFLWERRTLDKDIIDVS
jgi:hypothetical protein